MKITMMILGVALLGFASCKKDYTCTCNYVTVQKYVDSSGNTVPGTTQSTNTSSSKTITDKKDEATAACTGGNGTISQNTGTFGTYTIVQEITTTCTISE